jgi:hypothetical protein
MAPAVESFGMLLLAAVVFLFCWSLIFGLSCEGDAEQTAAVNELLVQELAADRATSLPSADGASVSADTPVGSIGHDPK